MQQTYNSKQIADFFGLTDRCVRKYTLQALSKNQNFITIEGQKIAFEVCDIPKKTYKYTLKNKKYFSDFDIDLSSKLNDKQKEQIKAFIATYRLSIDEFIRDYAREKELYINKKDLQTLRRKLFRIFEAKTNQSKPTKQTSENIKKAYVGVGSKGVRKSIRAMYDFYRFLQKDKPLSFIGFYKAIKKLEEENPQLKDFKRYGFDGLSQDYVVGVKDIAYINQEWQVDATKFDFMCKVNGEIKRLNLLAVIDVYSGCAVGSLVENIDSINQVKVLYKAMSIMGKPESIYSDNGRDYVSAHYTDVCQRLGINQIKARVGQGRQKITFIIKSL